MCGWPRNRVGGPPYWLKLATQTATASVHAPKYQIDVNTMEHLAAKTFELNSIGVANLVTDKPIVFEPYASNRELGAFILINKLTNATVAAGMLHFSLRRSQNIHRQALDISRECACRIEASKSRCFVVHGLSGAGKSRLRTSWRRNCIA